MVEKSGDRFESCSTMFEHAAHNSSNYLKGHCMVSLLISFPVFREGMIDYLSVPLGYRLWDKEKTKLASAAELVQQAMAIIGCERQVILLCDSWYTKVEVADLVRQFENLELICNARVDTVLYDLPPARTRKRGCPKKHGDRLYLENLSLSEPETGDWLIGVFPGITRSWKDKIRSSLLWLLLLKRGKEAAACFCVPETRRKFPLIWNCVQMILFAHMAGRIVPVFWHGTACQPAQEHRNLLL